MRKTNKDFFRESGQLWQTGHFEDGKKNRAWLGYDKNESLSFKQYEYRHHTNESMPS